MAFGEMRCPNCNAPARYESQQCPICSTRFSAAEIKRRVDGHNRTIGCLGLIAIVATFAGVAWFKDASRVAPVKPAPPAAAAKPSPVDLKAEGAAIYVTALRREMNDPASLQLQDARLADDGTFCVQYRGKNSFGATVLDTIVLRHGKEIHGDQAAGVYDRYCTGTSPDLSAAVTAILPVPSGNSSLPRP